MENHRQNNGELIFHQNPEALMHEESLQENGELINDAVEENGLPRQEENHVNLMHEESLQENGELINDGVEENGLSRQEENHVNEDFAAEQEAQDINIDGNHMDHDELDEDEFYFALWLENVLDEQLIPDEVVPALTVPVYRLEEEEIYIGHALLYRCFDYQTLGEEVHRVFLGLPEVEILMVIDSVIPGHQINYTDDVAHPLEPETLPWNIFSMRLQKVVITRI